MEVSMCIETLVTVFQIHRIGCVWKTPAYSQIQSQILALTAFTLCFD